MSALLQVPSTCTVRRSFEYDAAELLCTIHHELQKVHDCDETTKTCMHTVTQSGITRALFVSLHAGGKGFDSAVPETDTATLYSIDMPTHTNTNTSTKKGRNQIKIEAVAEGLLREVNEICRQMDEHLAKQIRTGQIHGLICVSCSVDMHAATLQAATERNIPVTGSGGTSLSSATCKFGITLVGNAGGSVATTSYTRAVSYTHALATAWKAPYRPFSSKQQAIVPSWTSVFNSCLPAFWAVVLTCRIINLLAPMLFSDNSAWVVDHVVPLLQTQALPTVCCVVMANARAPHHGSTAVMAASLASVVCQKSILGGLLAGFLVASTIDHRPSTVPLYCLEHSSHDD